MNNIWEEEQFDFYNPKHNFIEDIECDNKIINKQNNKFYYFVLKYLFSFFKFFF